MIRKKKPAMKVAKPAAKQYVVLETFYDRSGRLYRKGDEFPATDYTATELKIYTTKKNKIGRAVVVVK